MPNVSSRDFYAAVQDFRRARRRAMLEQIFARLTGKSADLLSYEQVRQELRVTGRKKRELKDIPLDAIVGSVGRYTDFTRSFLPRQDSDEGRWTRVQRAMTAQEGVPPIEVYQIGAVYFVLDGNHRVSVARQLGASSIEAYVTELHTKVPLSPDVQPDDLILKSEYADFLNLTHLDTLRPRANLNVTLPGQYEVLKEHIEVHRYFMGLDQQRDISYEEAVTHWYDAVYLPVLRVMRERNLLRRFPERTEADLYVWVARHRAELAQALEWDVGTRAAVADLAAQAGPGPEGVVARAGAKLLRAVTPDELKSGPEPGEWRTEHRATRRDERLFTDILVPVSGEEAGWQALEQALEVARREGARLQGLHVVPSETHKDDEMAQAVQAEFARRCEAAGMPGKLVLAAGKVPHHICERSRWVDLVILNLAHPPLAQPFARLGSGFRTVIRRCSRPVMAVPGKRSPLNHALLAYDGSPKAQEALFIATYLGGKWGIPLTVVTVTENSRITSETLARAQAYLETHQVPATFVEESGPAAEAILRTAEARQSDLILMGGYGHSPMVEVVLGSAVDEVLRTARQPVLFCR
jgi:nucleotide-binding universal stress UspA family protein